MIRDVLAAAVALAALPVLGQRFSGQGPCDFEPNWSGVSCSFYRAVEPRAGPKTAYHLRELRPHPRVRQIPDRVPLRGRRH